MNNNPYQFKNYEIIQQIGKGTFGTILKAIKKHQSNTQKSQKQQQIAIKIQTITTLKPLLHIQYELLKKLKQSQLLFKNIKKGYAFPNVHEYQQTDYFSCMTMQLLNITLQDYTNKQQKNKLSKDCLIRILYNLLKIIENIHNLGYIHRDIKPSNFMLKKKIPNSTTSNKYQPIIYPIDLGLAKKYINPITNKHINYKQNKKLIGTAIFCSLNTHKGVQQSRRDDLESLIYVVTYLVKKLPWQTVTNNNNNCNQINQNQHQYQNQKNQKNKKIDTYEQIYKIKKQTNFKQLLCDSQFLPQSIWPIYCYIIKLDFDGDPNYKFMFNLLQNQHYKLTNIKINEQNSLCEWQDHTKSTQQNNQTSNNIQNEKKKIKINFKIPNIKLKSMNNNNNNLNIQIKMNKQSETNL